MAIVYQHIRKDSNEVFYVGIGLNEERAYTKDSRNRHWKNIVNKHGYIVEITHKDILWEEACVIEKYLIQFYGRKDLGLGMLVNKTDGGDGIPGMRHSEETRKKISQDNLRPEKLKVCIENLKKAQTPEAKKKRYENIDYSFMSTPEFIAKRVANTDYTALTAKINTKERAKNLRKPVIQCDLRGNHIKEWESGIEASRQLNIGYKALNRNLRGLSHSSGGFIWKYKI